MFRSLKTLCLLAALATMFAAVPSPARTRSTAPGDQEQMLWDYFEAETMKLQRRCMTDIKTVEDWRSKRGTYKTQLLEMLSLDPLPEKTELKAVVTGKVDHEQFTVENLHFQSQPHLYVTANLYIPKNLDKSAPAILYVCGHGGVKKDGVSYGNKVRYQHHGAWFARHGYVCLAIDSLQLGEIESIHHGTYRYDMWWWNNRGYTPAGVEAWNCVRALDYLETRPEVDAKRMGVTGRSGGGAYSWWISAIDERISAAVPVAGITDLENHVVDGTVEGHCDCMFMVNTYRWDYPQVAAMVAPRPLLISNSDKDGIFPLDGVYRLHQKVARLYDMFEKPRYLGLHITEGPHNDTQELRVHAFVWFNRFLKDDASLIDSPAVALFEPEQLKVFDELPADEINTKIHEVFVPKARAPRIPESRQQWRKRRQELMKTLRRKCFAGWPSQKAAGPLDLATAFEAQAEGITLKAVDFTSQPNVRLRIYMAHKTGLDEPKHLRVEMTDDRVWSQWLSAMRAAFEDQMRGDYKSLPGKDAFEKLREQIVGSNAVFAWVAPRGTGPHWWQFDNRKYIQIRRRFMLLGQTLDSMRVWDVRRALQALKSMDGLADADMQIIGYQEIGAIALYASLFEQGISAIELHKLPPEHRHVDGPVFLNVNRYTDIPEVLAMAAQRTPITLKQTEESAWRYAGSVAEKLRWPRERVNVQTAGK